LINFEMQISENKNERDLFRIERVNYWYIGLAFFTFQNGDSMSATKLSESLRLSCPG